MRAVPLVCLIVADTTLPGADRTIANVREIGDWIAMTMPELSGPYYSVVTFEEVVKTPFVVLDELHALTQQPCMLLLYITGHSKLWRGQEAAEASAHFGTPTLIARDGTTERISALMYDGRVALAPIDIKHILYDIPETVIRTLFFIDTCHSMSLVSVQLVPPIDMRIIHSSADDEKTWQSEAEGSFMSAAWAQATRDLPPLAIANDPTPFWTTMQTVARSIQSQLLTSGPGQAFTFF